MNVIKSTGTLINHNARQVSKTNISPERIICEMSCEIEHGAQRVLYLMPVLLSIKVFALLLGSRLWQVICTWSVK